MKHSGFHRAIVALTMMLIGWLPSLAHHFEVDGVFYIRTSYNTVGVTFKGDSYHSYSNEYIGDIVIPSSVNYNGTTYSVTSIGWDAFHGCDGLTSIEIPNSVTSIGDSAFHGCSKLTSIQIPNSVTSIGDSAFHGCSSLTSIEIPNSVTWIGMCAFSWCESLTSIIVDSGNTKYDSRNGCNAIIETASNTLIAGCKNTIIPNSVTSIGEGAFWGCSSLTSIQIPNSVTSIGKYAFEGCSSLTNVQIPNSVTSIGERAFRGCSSLTSIQIPNSVTSIGERAFAVCSSLTSIEIPNSVTSIGDCAFWGCSSLTSIIVDSGNTKYDSRNGCNAIIETASNTLIAGCQNTIIPDSVTSIGDEAFSWCDSLTSIEIPYSVTSIGEGAFLGCLSLTSVVIGNSVTSIGNSAFQSCISLTKITCLAATPPTIESSTFSDYYAELNVPISCISAYQSANYWKNFNIKEIPTLSTSIALNKTSASLKATETLTLVATILPENATNKSVTWKSSNEAVATVDANGKVTAVAVGEATITATTADGSNKSAICKITVAKTLATSISLDKTSATLKATETLTLKATVAPATTTDKSVTWKSSNEAVATVDANGKVTAVTVGEATITATTADGSNKSATCKITVAKTLAESVTLDKTSATLKATETLTLKATVAPATTTNKSVTWKSSNESIATVDSNGKVTAVAVGEATITATTADGSNKSATCKVTVTSTLATSITLNHTEYEMVEKAEFQLTATILPEMTTNKSVVWSSSDAWVAPVDENGLVRAYSVGEAIITATTTDGSNLSATCKVVVKPTLATSITLNHTEYEMVEKAEFQLSATILPEMTTNKSVVWSSSDAWVAPVDENGLVRAYSVGEAVITATTIDGSNLSASCKVTVVSSLAQSITLDKTEVSLKATETATLVATVLPENTTEKSVEWSSSNEAVATVDATGKVTAIAVGEAIITAATTDGSNLTASCKVTVVPTLAESITLDKTEISLEATETATLIATVLPELATDKSVKWSSSNEAIAVVDENGVVTAVAVGEATITATTTDGSNLSASCKVVVKPTLATSITLDYTEYEMVEKADFQLSATILPELTTNKGVVWSSSDAWVASVDENGLVRAYSLGEAVITATTADGSNLSASCKVTVVSSLAQSITLDKTEVSLEATETAALVATVLPKLASNKSVEWSSSNEAIAVVDENGVVTAISIGEAVITATTADGSNLSASCKVTVVPTLAVSIELDKTQVSNEEKTYIQLTATILPEHTTNKKVAWSSSEKVFATVDDTGLVFVKSVGEVVITATTTDGSNLSASCYINVYSSDIDGVEGDDLIVATIGDNIVVKNAKLGSVVNVYASNGASIASEVATDGDVVVEAPIKGVYIVSVNGKTFKVMVK